MRALLPGAVSASTTALRSASQISRVSNASFITTKSTRGDQRRDRIRRAQASRDVQGRASVFGTRLRIGAGGEQRHNRTRAVAKCCPEQRCASTPVACFQVGTSGEQRRDYPRGAPASRKMQGDASIFGRRFWIDAGGVQRRDHLQRAEASRKVQGRASVLVTRLHIRAGSQAMRHVLCCGIFKEFRCVPAGMDRNLSTTLRHRRFLFTDSFLLLWKWRVG